MPVSGGAPSSRVRDVLVRGIRRSETWSSAFCVGGSLSRDLRSRPCACVLWDAHSSWVLGALILPRCGRRRNGKKKYLGRRPGASTPAVHRCKFRVTWCNKVLKTAHRHVPQNVAVSRERGLQVCGRRSLEEKCRASSHVESLAPV
jgi:hypothetical protein